MQLYSLAEWKPSIPEDPFQSKKQDDTNIKEQNHLVELPFTFCEPNQMKTEDKNFVNKNAFFFLKPKIAPFVFHFQPGG